LKERENEFLKSLFKKYYFDYIDKIPVPDALYEREFGYQKFDGVGAMIRHIQIADAGEFKAFLMGNAPSDVYCSNGYYSFPALPLKEKDWQGADLIFDIDAKDLELPCRKKHVLGVCEPCCRSMTGNPDGTTTAAVCDGCGGSESKMRKKSLPCKPCMQAAKKQVRGLVDILCRDLGVSPGEIKTYFSGNEGFHLHVAHDAFRVLGRQERSDLADYIMLKGLVPETMGMSKIRPDKNGFADLHEGGWRGRFAKAAFGSKTKRASIISGLVKSPDAGYVEFQKMMDDAAARIGIQIDPGVTMDVHRIFRMPFTLNSKSGMQKAPCPDVDAFDPYTAAVVLDSDSVAHVVADCPVRFGLGGRRFGPYKAETVELPAYAAAYMICKGFARMA